MKGGIRHEDLVAALDAESVLVNSEPGYFDRDVIATWMSQSAEVAGAVTTGPPSFSPVRVPARNVIAVYRFRGGPGRETEAAEAWAFEITYYFLRGVGEQPIVTYQDGIYTVSGLMTTTHPWDRVPETVFGPDEPPHLDWIGDRKRRALLREMYPGREHWRFDGRDPEGE